MSIRLGMLAFVVLLFVGGQVRAADGVTDAKRRAAAELIKQGKNADAVALLREVVKVEPDNYHDHLALARAFDKLNKSPEAVAEYHRVLELLSASDDRAVRLEAERRLKVLDALGIKIDAAAEEFSRKLDLLEREAIGSRDMAAIRRVFALKGSLCKATGRRDRTGVEVDVAQAWQDTGFTIQPGKTYRIRAAGVFHLHAGVECTADGLPALSRNGGTPPGILIGKIEGQAFVSLGSSGRFSSDRPGHLLLLLYGTMSDKADSSGTVTVLVEQE
jgi:tetratricopeptide (TPR) repeat protein